LAIVIDVQLFDWIANGGETMKLLRVPDWELVHVNVNVFRVVPPI
jgi:hypothetical protein